MCERVFRCIAAVLMVSVLASSLSARQWRSRSDDSTVEAELVDLRGGDVVLRREDGSLARVPLAKLSLADVQYVEQYFQAAVQRATQAKQTARSATMSESADASTDRSGEVAKRNDGPPLAKPGVGGWQAADDPFVGELNFPRDLNISIDLPEYCSGSRVHFPATPSPYAVVQGADHRHGHRVCWNLSTQRQVGDFRLEKTPRDGESLSPDGKRLAVWVSTSGKLEIWSFVDGQLERELSVANPRTSLHFLAFADQDSLVAAWGAPPGIFVFDINTGQVETKCSTDQLLVSPESCAISPGGTYLAVRGNNVIRIIDLRNGATAGELTLPPSGERASWRPAGLCFTRDGNELAGLFEAGSGATIFRWDMTDGSHIKTLKFPRGLTRLVRNAYSYDGPAIEYFPDAKNLLAYGAAVIDREIGGPVWIEPRNRETKVFSEPRRLLDGQRLAAVVDSPTGPRLRIIGIASETIQAGTELVASGATAADVLLPPLTIADWSTIDAREFSPDHTDWEYQPPKAATTEFEIRPIETDLTTESIRRLMLSDPAAGKALITHQSERESSGPQFQLLYGDRMTRFDLRSGEADAAFTLPFETELQDYSPSGDRLLCRIARDLDRLDIFELSASGERQQQAVAFRPYQETHPELPEISWAAFTGDDHVLTLNGHGDLVLWQLPTCQAVYALELGQKKRIALSPDRRTLAILGSTDMTLVDALTGRTIASLPTPDFPRVFNVYANRFSWEGTVLATVVASDDNRYLVTWDLIAGRLKDVFPLTSPFRDIVPMPTGNVLLLPPRLPGVNPDASRRQQLTLIDPHRALVLWQYQLLHGLHADPSTDGRHWFAWGQQAEDPATLAGYALPDTEAIGLMEEAEIPAPSISKGSQVSLEIDLPEPPMPEREPSIRDTLRTQFQQRLSAVGMKIVEEAEVRLQVKLNETKTEKSVRILVPSQGMVSVPVKKLNAEVAIVDSEGRTRWTRTREFATEQQSPYPAFFGRDAETFVYMNQWNFAIAWLTSIGIPTQVYDKALADGLGESNLAPTGPQVTRVTKVGP